MFTAFFFFPSSNSLFFSPSSFLPPFLPHSLFPLRPLSLPQYLYYWQFDFYFLVLWYISQHAGLVENVNKCTYFSDAF